MLIAEELLLLLTKDQGTAESWGTYTGYGLSAAVVTDLILAERVTLSDDKDPRVRVVSTQPTGHKVLDTALERLGQKTDRKLSSWVQDRKLDPTKQVVEALAEAGIVTVEPKRMLGLIPEKRPTVDPRPEQQTRDRLRRVLHGEPASVADAALLSILQGLDVAAKVLEEERGGMSKRDLKDRIKLVGEGLPAGTAVEKSVQMMNTIIVTTAIIPAITTSTSN